LLFYKGFYRGNGKQELFPLPLGLNLLQLPGKDKRNKYPVKFDLGNMEKFDKGIYISPANKAVRLLSEEETRHIQKLLQPEEENEN
jgi:hypothetical protein